MPKVAWEKLEDIGNVERYYEVSHLEGDGGQGDLFAGRDRASGRKIALKVQKPLGLQPPSWFRSEGDRLVLEGHKQLLTDIEDFPEMIAIGWYRRRRCLVMEFVEGRQLRTVLMSRRPLKDVATVASIIGQLCEILDVIHQKELVHCDLKPENVIVEPDGKIRLIDMGHAVWRGCPTEMEHGTLGYASPAQWDPNPSGLTEHADVYALGAMLLEMTVMRLPYITEREERPLRGCPVLPPDRLTAIPPKLAPLALQMVEWDAHRRPPNVREVFARLRSLLPTVDSCRRPVKPLRPDPTEYYRTHVPRL